MQGRYTPILLSDKKGKEKTYRLIFNFNALVTIERELGKSIQQLFQSGLQDSPENFVQNLFSAENTLVFLTAGLQEQHPEITKQELGQWLTISDYTAVVKTVASALFDALGGGLPEKPVGKTKTHGGQTLKKSRRVLA